MGISKQDLTSWILLRRERTQPLAGFLRKISFRILLYDLFVQFTGVSLIVLAFLELCSLEQIFCLVSASKHSQMDQE